ncbi:Arf-GAP with Rho-GAP domain, ANK repeat and PH domain-containing protein 2, partial [Larimichthys crocea]
MLTTSGLLIFPWKKNSTAGLRQNSAPPFIRRKYRERKYGGVLEGFHDLEQLNQALCAAVVLPDVLRTMELVFSGADVMCATGDLTVSTPYLLAQRAGQRLQMEFLHQNKLSDFPRLEQWSENTSLSDASLFMDGFLYISSGSAKTTLDRRGRDDMSRRWCTLEGGFLSYYESERSPSAIGRVDVTEVVSLVVSNTETMTGAGAVFTVELYLQTERVLIVGAETQETQHDWIQALTKCFVPPKVEGLVQRDCELIGRLHYKEGHDLYHWRMGWFMLEGSSLHFSSGEEEGEEEVLQLKQLQELRLDGIRERESVRRFSPAGDLIFEVYLEKKQPENCCLIKVSPSMRSTELVETALSMRNIAFTADDFWTTFEVIENGELERPLHHSEKILEQVLEWSNLDYPSSAFLVIKKFSGVKRATDGKADQKQFIKSDCLKFSDGSSKLLSGHKFQDKYVVLRAEKLLLYRDIKGTKAEKAIQLKSCEMLPGPEEKAETSTQLGLHGLHRQTAMAFLLRAEGGAGQLGDGHHQDE